MLFCTLPLLATLAARAAAPDAGDEAPEPAPVTWGATDATYTITIPPEGPLEVELNWRFAAIDPAWMDVPLAGRQLVVESVDGPAIAGPYGLRALLAPAPPASPATPAPSRTQTVTVHGTLDRSGPGAASLSVLPAARQRVIVVAPGLDVTVAGAKDGWLAAADQLSLTWRPHVAIAPATQQPLAQAEVSTAVWAEPGALLTRAAVRWRVVRGELGRFELDVAGLEEVEVTGANLERAVREGDRMVLTPRAPVKGTFAVDVRARRPLTTDAEVPAPAPRPIASRVERYWTVGRAEDGELVPVGGPRAVPARALPEWARGLSDTPPESFWQGDAPLRVRLARFTPLMGPDTVIERAELVVAAAAEGRALVRTTWHVRNERRQYLHVRPSEGLRPMTARVSGDPVSVLSDGAGGVYVPLEKSVETVEGLLTFPVELTWIAEGEAWAKKGERTLKLPSVDAPIQAAEWEVYLPRGWTTQTKRRGGRHTLAEPEAPAPPVNEEADEALQSAVSAYKSNRFEEAQQYLEHARAAGSTSANVGRLQSNLDVLLDDTKSDEVEDVATRRVRELANAKTVSQQVEQEEAADKARWAYQSGDVDEAERYLNEVIALADDIGKTEQKESAEQSGKKAEAEKLLKEVVATKAKRKADKSPPTSTSTSAWSTSTTTTTIPTHGDREKAGKASGAEIVTEEEDTTVAEEMPAFGEDFLARVPAGREYEDVGVETGGVEGGVVGGVVGGVLGGVAGGQDAPANAPATRFVPTPEVANGEAGEGWDLPPEAPPADANTTPVQTPAVSRDYESVLTTAPGVTAEPLRVVQGLLGAKDHAARQDAKPAPKPAPRAAAGKTAPDGKYGMKKKLPDRDYDGIRDQVDTAPVEYDERTEIDFNGLDVSGELAKPQAALVLDPTLAVPPPPPPPPEKARAPEARAALEVKAAPLTLALPLDGELVRDSAALLPADAWPTLTLPYRLTKSGASR